MPAQSCNNTSHSSKLLGLAGEAQDFEPAKWISTGQIYLTNPPALQQCKLITIPFTTYPTSAKVGLCQIMQ